MKESTANTVHALSPLAPLVKTECYFTLAIAVPGYQRVNSVKIILTCWPEESLESDPAEPEFW